MKDAAGDKVDDDDSNEGEIVLHGLKIYSASDL